MALGATLARVTTPEGSDGFHGVTMLDPEENEFCVGQLSRRFRSSFFRNGKGGLYSRATIRMNGFPRISRGRWPTAGKTGSVHR
ncbi:hypothetical protein [Streptosporangium sp. V21-05]|uniref:hypothetical protein n=1 Tax=Streptosporangium sp. V21-05 TaxID=3446115 RepID=UPI003F53B3FD